MPNYERNDYRKTFSDHFPVAADVTAHEDHDGDSIATDSPNHTLLSPAAGPPPFGLPD